MRTPSQAARRELLTRLAKLPLFAGLDAGGLSDLADAMIWLALPGGSTLFEQGEVSDSLYVLLYGRLAAIRIGDDGSARPLGCVAPGECVGEIGLITQSPRSATVAALRDSELLRLPRDAFEKLIAMHPAAMLSMARVALRRSRVGADQSVSPHCFALLPVTEGIDVRGFAERLATALGAEPQRALVTAEQARERDAGWFSAREGRSTHLLYVGNGEETWRERCLRQSDCVLLLADGAHAPDLSRPNAVPPATPHVQQHLVLLQSGEPPHGRARAWRDAFVGVNAHHHLRDQPDLERLARRLSGKAVGLVLSGGGARGFAHIGVVRGLREAGIHIDYVGGASIGAVIGAGIAADWPYEQLVAGYRRFFVDTNPLSDWTLPLVSLRAGRKVSKLLHEAFGERDIEDLPVPFYAVSSNLTAGALHVHERGTLWKALRATCAIPGVLPPLFGDGQVLVDGGVIDNMPVGEMRKRLAGEIIAVDVGGNYRLESHMDETELPPWWQLLPEWFGVRKRPSIAQILLRSGMVNSAATVQRRRKQTKLLLKPMLPGIDLLEWRAFDRAIDLGYQYTLRHVGGPRDSLGSEAPVIG
jgi:NTE family protein